MRVVRIAASCIGLLTTFGTLTSMAADVSTPFIGSIINVGVTPLRCHFQHYFFAKK